MNNLEKLCVIIDRDYRKKKIFHGQMTDEYVTITDSKIEIRMSNQTIAINKDIILGKDLHSCNQICHLTSYITIDTLFTFVEFFPNRECCDCFCAPHRTQNS